MAITNLETLGSRIRVRRTELGMSQGELADRIGATRQWISRLEQGKDGASVSRLLAVCDELDLVFDVRAPASGRSVSGFSERSRRTSPRVRAWTSVPLPQQRVIQKRVEATGHPALTGLPDLSSVYVWALEQRSSKSNDRIEPSASDGRGGS